MVNLNKIRKRIKFTKGDGFQVIKKYLDKSNVIFFIDHPYTASKKKAGTRLYKHHQINHEKLFELMTKIKGDFLMTYDDADEMRPLALKYRFETRLVAMNNTHHATMTELLIGRNLNWIDKL
jgi:DNA adenine methylase